MEDDTVVKEVLQIEVPPSPVTPVQSKISTPKTPKSGGGSRGNWSAEEDELLRQAVKKHGGKNWKKISVSHASLMNTKNCYSLTSVYSVRQFCMPSIGIDRRENRCSMSASLAESITTWTSEGALDCRG